MSTHANNDVAYILELSKKAFDYEWYEKTYSIKGNSDSLFKHYSEIGWKIGYNPSAFFDKDWYLSKYDDLLILEGNPLYHYLEFGFFENRQPCPWIDPIWFSRKTFPDKSNPIIYYLDNNINFHADPHPLIDLNYIRIQLNGKTQISTNIFKAYICGDSCKDMNPCMLFDINYVRLNLNLNNYSSQNILRMYIEGILDNQISTHPLFDASWYYDTYPHVRIFNGPLLQHYICDGSKEMLSPHILFDAKWYGYHTPVLNNTITALENYLTNVEFNSTPHQLFNDDYYVNHNNIVLDEPPLLHYITSKYSNAKTHPLFCGGWYIKHNPDCKSENFPPLLHYVKYGWKELRNPNSVFQEKYYQNKSKSSKVAGLVSYVDGGWNAGHRAHPLFDDTYYLKQLKKRINPSMSPLESYMLSDENDINTHPDFISSWYNDNYMRGIQTKMRPLEHFTAYGLSQCLDTAPWINFSWYKDRYNTSLSVDNIQTALDLYKEREIAGDHRVTSIGMGIVTFINERLGVKSEVSYDRNTYKLVSVIDIVESCGGETNVIRGDVTVIYQNPTFFGKTKSAYTNISILFPGIYTAKLYDVTVRSTSRMIIYKDTQSLAHDEMYFERCIDASSKLYGINVYNKAIYMNKPVCLLYVDRGIHLMNEHENNYFHWIVEMLPRINMIEKSLFADYPVVISNSLHKNMYDLLDIVVGVKYKKIKVPEKIWIRFGEVIYPSDVTYIPDVYDRPSSPYDVQINAPELKLVRDIILRHHAGSITLTSSRKICYFSRPKGIRRIVNETDVINTLKSQTDISVIASEDYSIKEQIEIFHNLDVAIMPTGASMTNILWCKPGTKVICLFSDHSSLNPYLWQQLADISQVQLLFVTGERTFDVVDKHSVHDNYFIDADQILLAMEEHL